MYPKTTVQQQIVEAVVSKYCHSSLMLLAIDKADTINDQLIVLPLGYTMIVLPSNVSAWPRQCVSMHKLFISANKVRKVQQYI